MKIAVAGTGYVGLSLATLLSQKNEVIALDVVPEKVKKLIIEFHQFKMNIQKKIFQRKRIKFESNIGL